jgi:hypothetical protein
MPVKQAILMYPVGKARVTRHNTLIQTRHDKYVGRRHRSSRLTQEVVHELYCVKREVHYYNNSVVGCMWL